MSISYNQRNEANTETLKRMCSADPVLTGIGSALDVVPRMRKNMILCSGPVLPWEEYEGGQRDAIIGGALFEGLAENIHDAANKLSRSEIKIAGCHDYGCVGSLAGIYTASMPVFVVENKAHGNIGYCNMYEGTDPRRLNYGIYDNNVRDRLLFLQNVVAPIIKEAVYLSGGISLKPLMRRGLHMGDELHSRSTATSLLFMRELFPHLLRISNKKHQDVAETIQALTEDHYFFLRLSMAAAKCTADAACDIEGSSVVTAMAFNCRNFSIKVSGLGDQWFTGPHATVQAKLFEGYSDKDIGWMGGESPITETIGLGGFAQAAAFPLQQYQGGSARAMIERNLEMYEITVGENSDYRIPYLDYRGTPTGIDIMRVVKTKLLPAMDIGIAGRDGGQIGAGVVRAPMECFEAALSTYCSRYITH